jgi:hypothetical protein
MTERRRYDDYSTKQAAAEIAHEVVATGESTGWCSYDPELKDLEALEAALAPFNIGYVDDMRGAWGRTAA